MRVYLADDDVFVRQALRMLIEQGFGFTVAGEAAHAHGLAALVEPTRADLVILEWELPGAVNAALLAGLHGLTPPPYVVVISSYPDIESDALEAGADAFVAKGQPPERLIAVLTRQAALLGTGRAAQAAGDQR